MTNPRNKLNRKDALALRKNLTRGYGDGHAGTVPCVYCGAILSLDAERRTDGRAAADTITLDRITPGSDGGRYNLANVLPACMACNHERGDRPFADFLAECIEEDRGSIFASLDEVETIMALAAGRASRFHKAKHAR
jgi:5-methylcytosine-specific restriction endonuclease McrA